MSTINGRCEDHGGELKEGTYSTRELTPVLSRGYLIDHKFQIKLFSSGPSASAAGSVSFINLSQLALGNLHSAF